VTIVDSSTFVSIRKDDFVPISVKPMTEVTWLGGNMG
jgi:hypothetical protein